MAYEEEYDGPHKNIKTWTYISEEEYPQLNTAVGKDVPEIYLATIKTDASGNPKQAKHRICVIGNLDPTKWSRNEVFAPAPSWIELHLFITIAVQKHAK